MNIVIIEDEELLAEDLEAGIRQLLGSLVSIVQIHSVKEGLAYFSQAAPADLIFSDIQLGDGLSFEILLTAPKASPVIFCTAYDEYALEAFKANGIDYILKPFTLETLERALQKYSQLKEAFSISHHQQFGALMEMLAGGSKQRAASVIVYHQDKIIPIKFEDIALFYLEGETTRLVTFSGKTYYPNKALDELEKMSPGFFFRANRQYLISRDVVIDASNFFSRKLSLNISVPLKEKIIISKAKAPMFLEWLSKG